MTWVVGVGAGILATKPHLDARRTFIHKVTNANVSEWVSFVATKGISKKTFFQCISEDDVNGIFITAHIDDVIPLLHYRAQSGALDETVIVNACKWGRFLDKRLWFDLHRYNSSIKIWFSKQLKTFERDKLFHPTTQIDDAGTFGFQTSLSERELHMHRKKGFMVAVQRSFEKVSPVILPTD